MFWTGVICGSLGGLAIGMIVGRKLAYGEAEKGYQVSLATHTEAMRRDAKHTIAACRKTVEEMQAIHDGHAAAYQAREERFIRAMLEAGMPAEVIAITGAGGV